MTGLHLAGLVADSYVHLGAADLLIPFASSWRPGAVALGVVAMYLLAAVELSSLLMRHLSRRAWRRIHLSSYGAFWLSTFHLGTAGTDASHPLSRVAVALTIAIVVFLTLVRALSGRGRSRTAAARPTETTPQSRIDVPMPATRARRRTTDAAATSSAA
jgi:DMSO/TMAO reductase YedYZ heme-binding membrane subunit